ncbi:MAG: DUF1735 domain-containing protein [Bacteroidota bacterium]|nr:DUF1735 domain-containing protein [Bacteroidota bacterium]
MKHSSLRPVLFLLLVYSLTAASCLKDSAYDSGAIQSSTGSSVKVISLGLNVSSAVNFVALSYNGSSSDTVVDLVPVELGGPVAAPQDLHVTVASDSTLIDAYNAANTDTTVSSGNPNPTGKITHYLSFTQFTIVNPIVTIPKGSRTAFLQIKFIPNDLIGSAYAIGFVIKSVAESGYTISGNLNTGVVALTAKNEWEGDYQVTGWFFHPSAGRAISAVKHLSTTGAIGLQGTVADLGSPFQFDVINNQATNWASSGFTSSGFMTADNPGGVNYSDPSNGGNLPGDAKYNSTIYNNSYDPATKTFYMHYGYVNGAVVGQNGYTRQVYEKWVRIN